ncbi:ATP-dependent helicase [Niabella hibiscisoli]|uniref:ATP-dependent helicase n=1 Tax=Niabella hibiscisoli TaxID=1825928 RepID=UPI001F106A62|nr:UvrD-helicase domain-containing protein [Niabella hibiscisoli]MCH5717132.1 UvrD-helicase domain-containing protein [Niabella hibiscisoli]
MQDYIKGLNERQKEAVLHIQGPIMIIAGAGSGKTKVLTTRIAHLMASGIDAFNILALTFTNKAAREMKERIEHILGGSEARNLYIGTFHSVFARILRAEAHRIGYPNNFTIYDTDDAKSVVKAVINEMHLDDKLYKPAQVYNRISSAKNALVSPADYATDYYAQQEDLRANRPAIAKIYDSYCKRCFKNGAMDFDDLLLKFYELLKTNPESLSKYQHKFKYILIDEYQDTNPAQYEVIKLLGAMHENVCVVGDDAQSIYSFRGATIQNILQFQKDYDEVKVVKLEQNYRSTQTIINAANDVIGKNKGQIPKVLFTENAEGEKIRIVKTMSDNEEGKFVADSIQEQKLRNHFLNKDFAILYRTNAQSRAFEEALRRMAIPYTMYGGVSFYQRKEIKDLVAYLRLIINSRDEEALKRIINYPVRGIGKTTIDKIILLANTHNKTMWEILVEAAQHGFRAGTLEVINNFVTMIRSFSSMLEKQNAYEVAFHVGKNTNLVRELFNDKSTEGLQRYENIQELLNSIKEWVESPDNEDGEVVDKGLGAYLQQITLLTDADEKDPDADTVKLMTIHAAKGLEFECVFAAGLEEMLFPNAMSINTREELEEERRLFYVVVTRAKKKLWVTYANTRYKFGQLVQNEPSRFIEELPEQFLDRSYAGGGTKMSTGFGGSAFERTNGGFSGGWSQKTSWESGTKKAAEDAEKSMVHHQAKKTTTPSYLPPKIEKKATDHTPTENFVANEVAELAVGQKVEHQKFGFGEIIKMEGASHNPMALIKFNTNGEKRSC